jgi:tetratricopeptide (TPR) repeat protein
MNGYDPLTLANTFIQAGELDDALDALNQHLEAHPKDDDVRRLRIQVLMRMPGDVQWQTILEDSLALKTPTVDDYLKLSLVSEQVGQIESAVFFVGEALKLQPDDASLIERHVQLTIASGNPSSIDSFLEDLPQHWRWLRWRGEAAALRDEFTHAINHYSAALEHLTNTMDTVNVPFAANLKAQILLKRADAYQRLNTLAEADADYADAEQIIPDDPTIPFNRGLIAFLQGQTERGIELCQNAYTSAPAALRDEMQEALASDERYTPVAEALQA